MNLMITSPGILVQMIQINVSMLRKMMEAKANPYWYHWNKQTMTELADEIQWRKTHRL